MTTTHRTERVGAEDKDQAKRQSHPDASSADCSAHHRGTNREEHEGEGSEELSEQTSCQIISHVVIVAKIVRDVWNQRHARRPRVAKTHSQPLRTQLAHHAVVGNLTDQLALLTRIVVAADPTAAVVRATPPSAGHGLVAGCTRHSAALARAERSPRAALDPLTGHPVVEPPQPREGARSP